MTLWKAAPVGCAEVVVEHHRRSLAQSLGPEAGLADRVVLVVNRRAVVRHSAARPSDQLDSLLVVIDEVDERNLAAGQLFHPFQTALHEGGLVHLLGGTGQFQQGLRPLGLERLDSLMTPVLSDVAGDAQHADELPFGVEHRGLDGFHQLPVAVVGENQLFFVDGGLAGGDGRAILRAEKVGQLPIHEIVIGLAPDLRLPGPVKPLETGVTGQVDALRVFQPDQVGYSLNQYFEETALPLQRCFHPLAFGDIGMDAEHAQRPTIGVALDQLAPRQNPLPLAQLGSLAEFHPVFGNASGDVVLVSLDGVVAVVWMQAGRPGREGLLKLRRVITEHGGVFGADDSLAGLHVQVVYALVGSGQRQRQTFPGFQ